MFRFALKNLQNNGIRVLEVGSGPGYISLELARNGFDVTGLELSQACVEVSNRMFEENPYHDGFGKLVYRCHDFLTWQSSDAEPFDGICFFQTLHHFDDVDAALTKAYNLLKPNGILIINEPARDLISTQDGIIFALIRTLLSASGNWHQSIPIPKSQAEFEDLVTEVLVEFREARDPEEPAQSLNDNSSYALEMLAILNSKFQQIDYEPDFAFVPRMVGGVRGVSEDRIASLAQFLCLVDTYLIEKQVVNPGGFYWAGRKA